MVKVEGSSKPLVMVHWRDTEDYNETTWVLESDLKEFWEAHCEVSSLGYLLKKTKGYVTLAADFIPPDTYGRITKIPRKMIVKIFPVRVEEPPKEPLSNAASE